MATDDQATSVTSYLPWKRRGQVVLCYLFPFLLASVFVAGVRMGPGMFFHGWLRIAGGPLAFVWHLMPVLRYDIAVAAVAWGLVWVVWLMVVTLSRLHHWSLLVHFLLGVAWCFSCQNPCLAAFAFLGAIGLPIRDRVRQRREKGQVDHAAQEERPLV
jgi:hypothetical protein